MTRATRRARALETGPGFASTEDLCRRWQVSRNTVARLALELGLIASPLAGRPRWSWRSVWRAEGRIDPPRTAWASLRQPLLTPRNVARTLGLADRTVRDRLDAARLPFVRLGPRLRRIDPAVLEELGR